MINFDEVVDRFLLRKREDSRRERDINVFFPSELTFPCLRAQYFKYVYPSTEYGADTLRIFEIGSMIHNFIQKIICAETEAFTVLDTEASIKRYYKVNGDTIQIRGRADALIQRGNQEAIIEIKSMKPQYFYDYKQRKTIRDDPFHFLTEPKPEHVQQIEWYMHNLHCTHGYILYVEKVAAEMKPFQVTLTNYKLKDGIVGTAKKLYTCLRDTNIPVKEPHHWGGRICDYCNYRKECDGEHV